MLMMKKCQENDRILKTLNLCYFTYTLYLVFFEKVLLYYRRTKGMRLQFRSNNREATTWYQK